MKLRFTFFIVFTFLNAVTAAAGESSLGVSDQVNDFYKSHTAFEMRKYCSPEKDVCRSLVYFTSDYSGELVNSFQISFLRTIEGKEANATELFIYDQDDYYKYVNSSDEVAVMGLDQAQFFKPENDEAQLSSVVRQIDGDVYIIDFVEQGHDIEFRASEVRVYSPEDELIDALTLSIVD